MSEEYKFGDTLNVLDQGMWVHARYVTRTGQAILCLVDRPTSSTLEPQAIWYSQEDVRRRPVTLQQPPAKGPAPDDAAVIWDIVRKHLGSPSVVGIGAQLVTALGKLKAAK